MLSLSLSFYSLLIYAFTCTALLNFGAKPKLNAQQVLESKFIGHGNRVGSSKEKDAWVRELEQLSSPIADAGLEKNYKKVAKALWRVSHAPHIRNLLEPLLFSEFDVYYDLSKKAGEMTSYVKFRFKPLGLTGHLNAAGTYDELDARTTSISWESIWMDFEETPTAVTEVEKHVLPSIVQPIGKRAFIQAVSIFPVSYLSKDLIIFTFKLLGTKIVACKC